MTEQSNPAAAVPRRRSRPFRVGVLTTLAVALMLAVSAGGELLLPEQHPVSAQTSGGGFVSVSPTRVFNTRSTGTPGADTQMTVSTGVTGATAVGVNITMTNSQGWGFLTAWASGGRPDTSVINVDGAGQTVANYVVVPVTAAGDFQLWTFAGSDIIVDLMGYYTTSGGGGGSAPTPVYDHGVAAEITGYNPIFSITEVSGIATNTSGAERDVRIDVACPNGTTETDSLFTIPAGATRGWSVLCDEVFTSGASIARVVEI